MNKYIFNLKSVDVSFLLEFNADSIDSYMELLSIFYKPELKNNCIILQIKILQMTEDVRQKYSAFCQQYAHKNKLLLKIKSSLDKIQFNKHFIITTKENFTTEEILFIQNIIQTMDYVDSDKERAKYFKELQDKKEYVFGDLLKNYEINIFDSKQRLKIGESDKNGRTCRFCGLRGKINFTKKAHAISEFLGFKNIVLNEECDYCNKRFGDTIEQDLLEYLKPYISFFGIKGKNGNPHFKYNNGGSIKFDGNNTESLVRVISKNIQIDKKKETLICELESNQNICLANVYKTLCKYAMSVINKKELQYFKQTIEWITSKNSPEKLPKIAIFQSPINWGINLVIYTRSNNRQDIPYMFCEFNIVCLKIVYIVPLSNANTKDFIGNEYDIFWKNLKHFQKIKNWQFKDFSLNKQIKIPTILKAVKEK